MPPDHQQPPVQPGAMHYFFHCVQCRRPIAVQPHQAGWRCGCSCGAMNVVPPLADLQRAAAAPTIGGNPFAAGQPASPFAAAAPQAAHAPAHATAPCPFCGRPMEPGRIVGDRYQLKWLDAQTPLTLGIWAAGGIPIGGGGFMTFTRPYVSGWRCGPCGKMIVSERE